MLQGFENITFELTPAELQALPYIVLNLKRKTKANPITNGAIVAALKRHNILNTNEPRVRKLISHIRINGIITNLVGDNSGYYCTQDPAELNKWVKQMETRAAVILAAARAAKIPNETTEPTQGVLFSPPAPKNINNL